MPNTSVRAAAEGMPAANETPIIGRFSRRAILGAFASVPTIAAATTALASTIPAAAAEHPDAELFRLDRKMEEVYVQLDKIERALRRIDRKVEKATGPRPLHPMDWKQPSMPDDLADLYRSALERTTFADVRDGKDWLPAPVAAWEKAVDRDQRKLVKAEWDRYGERRAEQRRLLKYDAKEAEHSEGCDAHWEIGKRIFAIPAHTFEGMAVKLRAGDRLGLEHFSDVDEAFLYIAADIRRLAGGGVS